MNLGIKKISEIAHKNSRLIIGLMSGTSLDGLDIALCKIDGFGVSTRVELIAFETINYSEEFKSDLKKICFIKAVDLEQICIINNRMGLLHAQSINTFLKKHGFENHQIDLIASHGQTIYHSPARLRNADGFGNATLQIGDGDLIAVNTKIITLSDFRQKNIAQGEEGAPLALYGDYLLFKSDVENRILLNIGGISNFTILKPQTSFEQVICSDLGPGNTLMDQFVQQNFKPQFYDQDANIAKRGKVSNELLDQFLKHNFFEQEYPKTTGPELFNINFLNQAQSKSQAQNLSNEDILATLNSFTAHAIAKGIKNYFNSSESVVVYISGGGAHNPLLLDNLKILLSNVQFKNTLALGINPDAKEAILFALLANETVAGERTFFSESTLNMGKISLPN